METLIQKPSEKKPFSMIDMAKEIAEKDPDTYGPDGYFPILKSAKQDGKTVEVVDETNFTRWMQLEIDKYENKAQPQITNWPNSQNGILNPGAEPSPGWKVIPRNTPDGILLTQEPAHAPFHRRMKAKISRMLQGKHP